jgi:hypothetical protein
MDWRAFRMVGLVLPLACASNGTAPMMGTGGAGGSAGPGDGRLFVPESLPASLQEGEVGVTLKLVAFTLVQGGMGPEFYAAVKNEGTAPSCNAGMMTELFDQSGDSVAMVGSALRGKQLYRLGSDAILNCIDPGQIGMAASTGFAADVIVSSVSALKYRFPTFEVDGIEPFTGIAVDSIKTITASGGSTFQGTLRNGSARAVSNPSVAIFPVNRVGRPLGAGLDSETRDLAPGDSWQFETNSVPDGGADVVAYASIAVSPN